MREIVRDALGDHVQVTGVHTDKGHIFFILHNPEWHSSMGYGVEEEAWYSRSREEKIELIRKEVGRLTND